MPHTDSALEMPKNYDHKNCESRISKMWEDGGYFKAERNSAKKPFTILLPLPNASGKMHTGNVLMIALEDLLIRWKRMQGYSALWVPGTDHAGFETQITFEKQLAKEGKSRFDFDRKTLYRMIWDFVQSNKHQIESQIKQMGASVDWSRYTFTLEDRVVNTVYNTFEKLHKDGLLYRGDYIVNYCPKCGTTFADLEIDVIERNDPLYFVKYPFVDRPQEYVLVATVRPETIFADVALAVNPKDKKQKLLVGEKVRNPLTGATLEVVADAFVDPKFGSGVVKITPAHDKKDYEVGLRMGYKATSQIPSAIDWFGKMTALAKSDQKSYEGLKVAEARKQVLEELDSKGSIDWEKTDKKYTHLVGVCYKAGHDIEPVILPNWFVKVDSLKKPALDAVKKGEVKIYPKWREITYTRWMEEMRDWPVSRQVVWGIRIPVWFKVTGNEERMLVTWIDKIGKQQTGSLKKFLEEGVLLSDIETGLQRVYAQPDVEYVISPEKPTDGHQYLPETDTFDTWFSSGQWPLVTLGYPESADFKYFYPTDVLETGWEIIRLWVSRMIMFGIYLTGKPPFHTVYLHGMVRALDGRKMSKSLGNVINPDDYIRDYGVDALRMGLISGTANGKDFAFPRDKVVGYRNFANKIWNMGRFILMMQEKLGGESIPEYADGGVEASTTDADRKILVGYGQLIGVVNKSLEKYRFAEAAEQIYHFMWDELASVYIESVKDRQDLAVALSVLRYVFLNCLKLLHPFMPFITEEVWGFFKRPEEGPLMLTAWPE